MSRRASAPQSSLKSQPRRKGRRASAFVNRSALARWLRTPESSPKPAASSPETFCDERQEDGDDDAQGSRALAYLSAPRTV
jgi:hypothetical protein